MEGEKARLGTRGSAHERRLRPPPSPLRHPLGATLAGAAGSACVVLLLFRAVLQDHLLSALKTAPTLTPLVSYPAIDAGNQR